MSEIKTLNVKRKHIISKVNTFKDLMMLSKSEAEKKQKILKLLTDDFSLITDKNYEFNFDDISFLMKDDKQFYLQVNEIYNSHFNNYLHFNLKTVKELIKD